MNLVLSLSALVILILLYAVSVTRARRQVAVARAARNEIYRNCFLRGLAGILAKLAKSDGSVSAEEEEVANRLFSDMGLSEDDRKLCLETFAAAKVTDLTGVYYANLFVPYSTRESRILVYEVLWDIAAADGVLAVGEEKTLRDLAAWLGLDVAEYARNLKSHRGKFTGDKSKLSAAVRSILAD